MNIFKQKEITGLGAVLDSIFMSVSFYSLINTLSTSLILWTVTISPWAKIHLTWLSAPLFFGVAIPVFGLIPPIMVFKYIIPSVWAFRARQMKLKDKE